MASYPNLISVTPNEVYHVTSPLAATWSNDQTFSVDSTAGWFEADATGVTTTIPLGQSGPFVLEVKAEKILCSEIKGNTVYVYQDNAGNGRAYSSTSAVAHSLGDAVTLIATSVQSLLFPAGSSITRHFNFTYATAGVGTTGAVLYTIPAGDILLDAWIQVNTVWNGTTPMGEVNTSLGGLLNFAGDVYSTNWFKMATVDSPLAVNSSGTVFQQSSVNIRVVPFTCATPVTIGPLVTSTGQGGGVHDSTAGTATLFITTTTPI